MGNMSRSIQVIPSSENSKKIDTLKKQLHVSRAGFCVFALEFVLPLIESGKMELVNGKLKLKPEPVAHRATA
jgi:hypothetical protein